MTDKIKHRIHLIYSIILTVMLIVAGICLMVACVGIYLSGSKPFTPDSVSAAFSGIAVPVYLCLILVAGGFVLDAALPSPGKKTTPRKQYAAIAQRLREKVDMDNCDPSLRNSITRLQNQRKLHTRLALGLIVIGTVLFLCYGVNPANFHQSEITESMLKAMYVLLPCVAIPFGYCLFCAYYTESSLQKEIALLRQLPVSATSGDKITAAKGQRLPLLRYALLGVGVAIALYGFFAGGTNDVLTKAINICTECVGLG